MDVTFDSLSAVVTIPLVDKTTDNYVWYASVGSSLTFYLVDVVGPGYPDGCQGYTGCGTLGFGVVSTPTMPEPSSSVLMLLGVGLLLMARKRIGHGVSGVS